MLVTGNDRRQAVHQRAGRGRGADVDLANPASGMQCRQRAVDANGLAGLDNTVVRVDAKQHPVGVANQLPQALQLWLHAGGQLGVGIGQWLHIQLPACQARLPRAEPGGPGPLPRAFDRFGQQPGGQRQAFGKLLAGTVQLKL
ncbi:hypothetical protein D3C80_1774800 [compost metagenome]